MCHGLELEAALAEVQSRMMSCRRSVVEQAESLHDVHEVDLKEEGSNVTEVPTWDSDQENVRHADGMVTSWL